LLALLGVYLKGKLDVDSFIQYMEAAKAQLPALPENDEFAVSLIESIWIKHSEIPKTDVQSKEAFNTMVKPLLSQLIEKQIVSAVDCHIHLEAETLIACKITRLDSDGFTRMASQANTQKHFSQHKFNLMREENEGFAKLLIEVNQPNIDFSNATIVIANIQRLIGYFSLDPSRVLDLILTAF